MTEKRKYIKPRAVALEMPEIATNGPTTGSGEANPETKQDGRKTWAWDDYDE